MSLWVIKWFRMSATFKTCSKWYSTIKLPESSEHLFPVFTSFDAVVHSLFGTELLLDGKNPECIIRNFAAAWNKSLLSQPLKAHTICCHGIKVLFKHLLIAGIMHVPHSVVMVEKTTLQCLIKLLYLYGVTIEL